MTILFCAASASWNSLAVSYPMPGTPKAAATNTPHPQSPPKSVPTMLSALATASSAFDDGGAADAGTANNNVGTTAAVGLGLAQPRGTEAPPAPPKIAAQIYTQATLTKMAVRHAQGEAMEKTIAWAESELEGFSRS